MLAKVIHDPVAECIDRAPVEPEVVAGADEPAFALEVGEQVAQALERHALLLSPLPQAGRLETRGTGPCEYPLGQRRLCFGKRRPVVGVPGEVSLEV